MHHSETVEILYSVAILKPPQTSLCNEREGQKNCHTGLHFLATYYRDTSRHWHSVVTQQSNVLKSLDTIEVCSTKQQVIKSM